MWKMSIQCQYFSGIRTQNHQLTNFIPITTRPGLPLIDKCLSIPGSMKRFLSAPQEVAKIWVNELSASSSAWVRIRKIENNDAICTTLHWTTWNLTTPKRNQWVSGKKYSSKNESRAVVVAQLVERLLPTPRVHCSNPVIGKKL